MIRPALLEDAMQIAAIYNLYIAETVVTFEEQEITGEMMAERMRAVLPSLPWLVWEEQDQIVGYAYATPWKQRSAYRHSVESTIYLHPAAVRRGIGTQLYAALIEELGGRNVHAVVGGIALPNVASTTLHEKLGFNKIAHFREVGRKFNRWVDVGYWELLL
jgi:L-amino acid N-acyltransferase YncA